MGKDDARRTIIAGVWVAFFSNDRADRNFELGVHVPLIMRAPFLQTSAGRRTDQLAELVDVSRHSRSVRFAFAERNSRWAQLYPTLAALVGLPDPRSMGEEINGTSLAPLFSAAGECEQQPPQQQQAEGCREGYVAAVAGLKDAAFAQFAKTCDHYAASCDLHNLTSVCVAPPPLRGRVAATNSAAHSDGACVLRSGDQFQRPQTKLMGYTVRTAEWRYTVWFPFVRPLPCPRQSSLLCVWTVQGSFRSLAGRRRDPAGAGAAN